MRKPPVSVLTVSPPVCKLIARFCLTSKAQGHETNTGKFPRVASLQDNCYRRTAFVIAETVVPRVSSPFSCATELPPNPHPRASAPHGGDRRSSASHPPHWPGGWRGQARVVCGETPDLPPGLRLCPQGLSRNRRAPSSPGGGGGYGCLVSG